MNREYSRGNHFLNIVVSNFNFNLSLISEICLFVSFSFGNGNVRPLSSKVFFRTLYTLSLSSHIVFITIEQPKLIRNIRV